MKLQFLDLFTFEPKPKTDNLSTKKSVCASIFFIVIAFTYIVVNFTAFIVFNKPKISEYKDLLPQESIIKLNEFAFNFQIGENLDQSFYDENYWTYDLV